MNSRSSEPADPPSPDEKPEDPSSLADTPLPRDPRTRARWLAVQALYEWDSTGHDPLVAVQNRLEAEPDSARVGAFARELVEAVRAHTREVDAVIEQAAPAWRLHQMAVVDRNILRVAVVEVLFERKTPLKAAVNEAVELAKTFGGEGSPRFVNGVLGAVAAMATAREQP